MRYRRIVLKEKLRDIEQLVTGRSESYLPLIYDENGRVTKEKTERFIEEMLETLRRYVAFDENRTLDEDTVKMYESFLYCALMSIHLERLPRDRSVTQWGLPSVFEDIIRIAEEVDIPGCESYNSYLEECYRDYLAECKMRDEQEKNSSLPIHYRIRSYAPETDSDFFRGLKEALEELGYPHFIKSLPEETLKLLENGANSSGKMGMAKAPVLKKEPIYNYDEPSNEEDPYGISPDEDDEDVYEPVLDENFAEHMRHLDENDKISEEIGSLADDKTYSDNRFLKSVSRDSIRSVEQNQAYAEDYAVIGHWKNDILFDEETLCENFYRFMWLYFDSPDRKRFVEDIENMVDTYLFEHGISGFSIGDDYGMVTYFIDHLRSRIEREIKRGRKK